MMRTVLVTQRLLDERAYVERREALDVRWGAFFAALDLLPVPMATEIDPEAYADLDPALVVLTGGNDLARVDDSPLGRARDAYERRVLHAAGTHDWPIFAVCRGMQLLASEAGASLTPIEGHVATEHGLAVTPGTAFAGLLSEVRTVNSFHRYAPTGPLAAGWRVCATAPNGTMEAIAHDSLRALGVMWHPERYPTPRPCDLALVRKLVTS